MTNDRFLNYGRHLIEDDDIAAVTAVLRGDLITQGPAVEHFEQEIAARVGAKHAVLVNSGTSALHIACLTAGLAPGDRGVTSAMTFVASANAIAYCGATPSVLDIDADGLGFSAATLSAWLERHPETKAVLPVLFSGLAFDSAAIRRAAGARMIVEDAAHALGGTYADGQPVGSCAYSDMTAFSFHPVKPITLGEGGCVTTNDDELARKLRLFRSHGIERSPDRFTARSREDGREQWYYEQQELGFNYRITDIQAALGSSQLRKLDRFKTRRRDIALRYDEAFAGIDCMTLPQSSAADRARSAHHLYVVLFDFAAIGKQRQQFLDEMKKDNVGAQVHYLPVYRQPYHMKHFGMSAAGFPATEHYYERCLSIPLFPDMTDDEVERVIRTVRKTVGA